MIRRHACSVFTTATALAVKPLSLDHETSQYILALDDSWVPDQKLWLSAFDLPVHKSSEFGIALVQPVAASLLA